MSAAASVEGVSPTTIEAETARYLRTGDSSEWLSVWSGDDLFARARCADAVLREVLIREVTRLAPAAVTPRTFAGVNPQSFMREKVEPLVRGLFPEGEQEVLLEVLAKSVVFLTPDTITEVLRTTTWRSTAWTLANLYLLSVGAEALSDEAPHIVGFSEGATCFVSMNYFETDEPLADFVVHEAAHVFHNCKREAIGLPITRRREWLLEIAFGKRETFAYACEAYSRLLELGESRSSRQALQDAHVADFKPPDERVERDEYFAILSAAVSARNGWKAILKACASGNAP